MFKYTKTPTILSKYDMPSDLTYTELNNIDFEVKIYEFENDNLQGQLLNFQQGKHFLGYADIGIIAKNNKWNEQDFFELLDFALTEFPHLHKRNTKLTIDNLFLQENKLEHCDIPSFMWKYGYNLQTDNSYKKNVNVPYFRFPEFTDEWEEKRLEEIVDRITRKNKDNETNLPLTISSIDGLVDQRTYFNKVVASKDMSGYYLLKNGEFAYNKSYSVGYDYGSIKRLDKYDMGALSTLYICFALKDESISDFLIKYFDSQKWYKEIYMISAEGARNHGLLNVPTEDFFKIKLHLPKEVEELQKIADFLLKIDEKISNQEAVVSDYEEMKKGLGQKIFSQEVRFKADDGSEYPEWKRKVITEIADTYIGLVTTMTAHYVDSGTPLIRNSDIKENKFVFKDPIYLDEEFAKKNDSRKHKLNDIITVHTGDIGTSALIPEELVGSIGFATIVTRITDKEILPKYICWYYNTDIYKKYARNICTGDGRNNLNMRDFNVAKIPIPCLKEQQKIADCLSAMDRKIEAEKKILEDWKELKKALLQQMFV